MTADLTRTTVASPPAVALVSSRVRYGARAMVELALASTGEPVSIERLASRQSLSPRYLAKIVQDLRRKGLVVSVRGAHGGYSLARRPADITMLDIWAALDGPMCPARCTEAPSRCELFDQCVMTEVWTMLRASMEECLGAFTLEELAERRR